jgi:hypothetical protein
MRPRSQLHPYQLDAIEFLKTAAGRLLVAIMGSGKTTVALHATADLKADGELANPVLVVAPLLIAETVWRTEAEAWVDTKDLTIELLLGPAKRRTAALDRPADIYVINYDNLEWLFDEIVERGLIFSVLIGDEISRIKTPTAKRTKLMLQLNQAAERCWGLTGTPRGAQLIDVWGPSQFCSLGTGFDSQFWRWQSANFVPVDQYARKWVPRHGVEDMIVRRMQPFTHVVDQAALATRPPVLEVVHDTPLDPKSLAVYAELDGEGTTDKVAAMVARGLMPRSEMAIVTKLMQVCSGASYNAEGGWTRLHDRRLDMLQELHEGHDRPTLVFITYRHELERIQERFPAAVELSAERIDAWNRGELEMLVAHPASAGHGVNLQHGSDTIIWFSLPWSAELYEQGNARVARQGQRSATVNIHILLSRGRIDEIALRVLHQRITEQERLIGALAT